MESSFVCEMTHGLCSYLSDLSHYWYIVFNKIISKKEGRKGLFKGSVHHGESAWQQDCRQRVTVHLQKEAERAAGWCPVHSLLSFQSRTQHPTEWYHLHGQCVFPLTDMLTGSYP